MITIDDIHKYIVKVNGGSGIIVKNDNKSYVLTVYHNIENSIKHEEEIELYSDNNEKFNIEKYYCDSEKDIALIEIKQIFDIPTIKYCSNIESNNEITFIGYPNKGKGRRKKCDGIINEWNNKNSIEVRNITTAPTQDERTNEIFVGFSGSAVFKITGNNKVSLIGLIKSLPEKDFYYNEISCVSIDDILYFLNKNNLSVIKPLSKKENTTMKNKTLNNPVFNIGNNNNSPINTGDGNQTNIYNQAKPEPSLDNAKELFHLKRYAEAKVMFSNLMINNDECKILFIICSLSKQKISHLNRYEIEEFYSIIGEITDENFHRLSNYLWLIILYEYHYAHSIPKILDEQHKGRRSFSIRNPLEVEEKQLLIDVKMVNEKSSFI